MNIDRDDVSVARLRQSGMASATYSVSITPDAARPFAVAAGLSDCLRHLQDFRLGGEYIGRLTEAGICSRATARSLRGVRFTGEVRAAPEGRVVLVGEPVLEVTAPLAVAHLVRAELLLRRSLQPFEPVTEARARSRADLSWLRREVSRQAGKAWARPRTSPRLRALRDRAAPGGRPAVPTART